MAPPDLEALEREPASAAISAAARTPGTASSLFRPVFPYFRYRMPVKGLYLCSSYAHPGAGVHGMCGSNAALIAARDAER